MTYKCDFCDDVTKESKKDIVGHLRMSADSDHGQQHSEPPQGYEESYKEITENGGQSKDGQRKGEDNRDKDNVEGRQADDGGSKSTPENRERQPDMEDVRSEDNDDEKRKGRNSPESSRNEPTEEPINSDISVNETEGDKLKPEGAEKAGSSVPFPEGYKEGDGETEADLIEGDDGGTGDAEDLSTSGWTDDESKNSRDHDREPEDGPSNSGEAESPTEALINDAETEEEKERRRDVRDELDESTTEGESGQVNLQMSQKQLEGLIGMPFEQLANVTEWDGWRLETEEKRTNAKLFKAYCEENNIEISTGIQLVLSVSMTTIPRIYQYRSWKAEQEGDGEDEPENLRDRDRDGDGDDMESIEELKDKTDDGDRLDRET